MALQYYPNVQLLLRWGPQCLVLMEILASLRTQLQLSLTEAARLRPRRKWDPKLKGHWSRHLVTIESHKSMDVVLPPRYFEFDDITCTCQGPWTKGRLPWIWDLDRLFTSRVDHRCLMEAGEATKAFLSAQKLNIKCSIFLKKQYHRLHFRQFWT